MKKIAISALALGLAYVGGAYLTGYLGEQKMREQLSISQAQSADTGWIMILDSYKRGIFSSDVKLQIRFTGNVPSLKNLSVQVDTHMVHGPVLVDKGAALGLFSATTHAMLQTDDAEVNQNLVKFFGTSIGEITTTAGFNNRYSARWVLPAKQLEEQSFHVTMEESSLALEGDFSSLNGRGEIHIGKVELLSADGSEIKLAPIEGSVVSTNIESGINIADMDLAMATLEATNAAGVKTQFEQLSYTQRQKVVNESIDTSVELKLAQLTSPAQASNIYYKVDLNQLSIAGLKAWTQAMHDLPSDPAAVTSFYGEQVKRLLPQFLQPGLSMKLAMGADFMGGHPKAEWELNYQPPADGTALADLTEPFEYLGLADSQLEVRLPEMLAMGLPMLTMMDNYITKEEGEYVLKAKLHNSELFVGATQIPTETVLMVLSGIGAKTSAAQEAQTQAAIDQAAIDQANAEAQEQAADTAEAAASQEQ